MTEMEYSPNEVPALLVSYFYLEGFTSVRHLYHYRDWAMDSGAYSAKNHGKEISLEEYTDKCYELLFSDFKLSGVFALDVIGDWRKSEKNTEYAWNKGVPAIPCFHFGEPWELLVSMARTYPKIALGGTVFQAKGTREKWLGQCFSRIWPARVHGFGIAGEKTILSFPFHSVDAASWEQTACQWGRREAYPGLKTARGGSQNLRPEVLYYLNLEQKMRARWGKEMQKLPDYEPDKDKPTLRLVAGVGRSSRPHLGAKYFCHPRQKG